MTMNFRLYLEWFFVPNLIKKSKRNILVYAEETSSGHRVICKRKVKNYYYTIIFDQNLLNLCYKKRKLI